MAHPYFMRILPPRRESEWKRFIDALGSVFPKPLPRVLGFTRCFHFDSDYRPISEVSLKAALKVKGIKRGEPINNERLIDLDSLAPCSQSSALQAPKFIADARRELSAQSILILKRAGQEGYRIETESPEVIRIERGNEGAFHLASNFDIESLGREKNWIL